MRESRIVKEWKDEARAEGLQEGREQGRKEGREEARLQTLRGVLLRLLSKRFPGVSAPEVLAAVQAQTNPDELMCWLDLIDEAASIEAFRVAIHA